MYFCRVVSPLKINTSGTLWKSKLILRIVRILFKLVPQHFQVHPFCTATGCSRSIQYCAKMPSTARHSGRIRPHQRDTDDTAAVLGCTLSAPVGFLEKYNETNEKSMSVACRKNYRQRLARIIVFWKETSPEYYAVGVREVSEEVRNDPTRFYYGRKLDLVYKGMNMQFFLHFLLETKRKGNGKYKSLEDLRKYKDSVMWGAKMASERLPTKFYKVVDNFLASYKKEFIAAKKQGNTEETSSDPIPMSLYKLVAKWALEQNNILVWFWTLSQWNCMARSSSIDNLGFHNLKIGNDSIRLKYDDSKADKAGERLSEKNIYANPKDWRLCWWTSFGIWCCLRGNKFKENERLFLDKDVKEGTAAQKYCELVAGLVSGHTDELMHHMDPTNFNPYGLRKGSATHACSGTTAPPSLPSIARRGEWSISQVLDVYWHFCSIGDHYLGRILAGLDPNDSSFGTLPPHWTTSNPMENDHIRKAMQLTFGEIVEEHRTMFPLLLRSLACIVYHHEGLLEQMVSIPGHDFTKIAIFHDRELLSDLYKLVTLKPTEGLMTNATGIPPHIHQASKLQLILEQVSFSNLLCVSYSLLFLSNQLCVCR
jgi:hypothetical protein